MHCFRPQRLVLCFWILAVTASFPSGRAVADPGSREDRELLFSYLLTKTLEREAFSDVKNRKLKLDIKRQMLGLREELINADSDTKLYYALAKLSNARKDRHLRLALVSGGLQLEHDAGLYRYDAEHGLQKNPVRSAPLRFAVDYGTADSYFLFVSDFGKRINELSGGNVPQIGDRLLAINGTPADEHLKNIEPYLRYSSINGRWHQFALSATVDDAQLPPSLYRDDVTYDLERRDGSTYRITLPYLAPSEIDWNEHDRRQYDGFRRLLETGTFDLYVSEGDRQILILTWHQFGATLVEDMDRLMTYAEKHELLDHALIIDGTRSRGGSKGAYAIQRLTPKPFKTTFGNLRISDVTPRFIEEKIKEVRKTGALDRGVSETTDGGRWLVDWLEHDVMNAVRAGQRYTNNVPFKSAHLPKWSDGVIRPAAVHFSGPLVCWFGPYGGSHLDQFAAIMRDNRLAYSIGMPTGGFSNTWEWEETLQFPISGKPIVRYMWTMGHTIRPNGEVLEGNPADVDEALPVTRENFRSYYSLLLSRTMQHLDRLAE